MPRPMKPIIGMSCGKTEGTFRGSPLPVALYKLFCSARPLPHSGSGAPSLPRGRTGSLPHHIFAVVFLNLLRVCLRWIQGTRRAYCRDGLRAP